MKIAYSIGLLTFLLPLADAVEEECIHSRSILDFSTASITKNDLQYGGTIQYDNVGSVTVVGGDTTQLDLVVSVQEGETYFSSTAYLNNGGDTFANINVRNTNPCDPDGENRNGKGCNDRNRDPDDPMRAEVRNTDEHGAGHFRFCIYDHGTNTPHPLSFNFFVFDLDNRGSNDDDNIKERLEVEGFDKILYPRDDIEPLYTTTLSEDGSKATFDPLVSRTSADNPDDPNNLSNSQLEISVGFSFVDTSCFDISFYEYCSKPNGIGCTVTGGNMLFTGSADQITPMACPTSSPTSDPTAAPVTPDPTANPTAAPITPDPTANPTAAPVTPDPTANPTEAPVTPDPTANPTEAPATPEVILIPNINIEKTVHLGDISVCFDGAELQHGLNGRVVTYCYKVTNIGEVHLEDVVVTDEGTGVAGAALADLEVGETKFVRLLSSIDGYLNSMAVAVGNPVDGTDPVSDADPAAVQEVLDRECVE